jgi:hypothetical protein
MRKKLIKKGNTGMMVQNTMQSGVKNAWQSPKASNYLNTSKPSNLNNLFSNEVKASNKMPTFMTTSPNLETIANDLGTKVNKGIEDSIQTQRDAYNKTNKWNNFKDGVGKAFTNGLDAVGKAFTTPGFEGMVGGGLDLGLQALGKEKDGISGAVDAAAPLLNAAVPGLGYAVQGLDRLDTALGTTTKGFQGNTGVSGYQDFSTQGKQFRLSQFGAKNKALTNTEANKKMFTSAKTNTDKLLKQQQARTQGIQNQGMTNQTKLSGGLNTSVLMGRNGATLEDIRNYIKVRNIKKEVPENPILDENIDKSENVEIAKFKSGGSVIPSGALHKNKHKLEEIIPELKGEVTAKGIPVITYAEKGDVLEFAEDGETPKVLAEGGEVIQHAEIEKEEVILEISLTNKLIELMKEGSEKSIIEAGKLLATELMENTTDNSGIMEKIIENEN